MPQWTTEQVMALAPDAASAKAGQSLVKANQWLTLGHCTDQAIWGECQGSGSKPYQTRIALEELAFKCSCPSRKFPCKHGLGLLLLWIQQPQVFITTANPPPWVAEWLDERAQRQVKKANKVSKTTDSVAQAKRAEQREEKVQAGLAELALWLRDLTRQGLAELQTKPNSFFEATAARMVDAQAPGLAKRVRELYSLVNSGAHWAEAVIEAVARLHLLIESYQRLATLSIDLQSDIRTLIGWTQSKEDVLQQPSLRERWSVLGQYVEKDEMAQLVEQRIWLQGAQSGKMALLLNFAPAKAQASLDYSWQTGSQVDAELCFYPSAFPLRALVKARYEVTPIVELQQVVNLSKALMVYKQAVSQQPWLERLPLVLSPVKPLFWQEKWVLTDESWLSLPLADDFPGFWELLASSGGHPLTIFGEWRGRVYYPLGIWNEGCYQAIGKLN
jgi:hypothetical protein